MCVSERGRPSGCVHVICMCVCLSPQIDNKERWCARELGDESCIWILCMPATEGGKNTNKRPLTDLEAETEDCRWCHGNCRGRDQTNAFKGVKGLADSSLEHTENISSAPRSDSFSLGDRNSMLIRASFCTLPPSQSQLGWNQMKATPPKTSEHAHTHALCVSADIKAADSGNIFYFDIYLFFLRGKILQRRRLKYVEEAYDNNYFRQKVFCTFIWQWVAKMYMLKELGVHCTFKGLISFIKKIFLYVSLDDVGK